MELNPTPLYTISGYLPKTEGERVSLTVYQYPPQLSSDGNYYSIVKTEPQLFGHERKIAGIDAAQSTELAARFIQSFLDQYGCLDIHGQRLIMPGQNNKIGL